MRHSLAASSAGRIVQYIRTLQPSPRPKPVTLARQLLAQQQRRISAVAKKSV
jgi:hypothetical protein